VSIPAEKRTEKTSW